MPPAERDRDTQHGAAGRCEHQAIERALAGWRRDEDRRRLGEEARRRRALERTIRQATGAEPDAYAAAVAHHGPRMLSSPHSPKLLYATEKVGSPSRQRRAEGRRRPATAAAYASGSAPVA